MIKPEKPTPPPRRNKRLRALVEARDHGCCRICGRYDPKWIADHIHEIWAGGPDDIDNLQTLCRRHDREKTSANTTARAKTDRLRERAELTRKRKPRFIEREEVC